MRRATAVQGSVGTATAGGWPTALPGTMGTATAGGWPTALSETMGTAATGGWPTASSGSMGTAAGAWPTALQGIMGNCGKKSCAQEEEQEADDLYMTDMPEPGQMEEDWLYMQQLYPNTARKLVYYIEDAADRLEYENSMMFDNYPDRIAVEQVVKEIIAVIQENDPALITMPEDTAVSERKGDQTWDSCMEEMIQIMLLGEMHHRRWRYQQLNRRNY